MKFKYYVVQTYNNRGRAKANLLTAEEAKVKRYEHGYTEETERFDLWVDGFNTIEEAKKFIKECKNA